MLSNYKNKATAFVTYANVVSLIKSLLFDIRRKKNPLHKIVLNHKRHPATIPRREGPATPRTPLKGYARARQHYQNNNQVVPRNARRSIFARTASSPRCNLVRARTGESCRRESVALARGTIIFSRCHS